jgi:hypothetical protein
MSWLRFVMLLALIVWIGGIIFFAFVVAPTYNQVKQANVRLFSPAHWLIAVMLALTAISQFGVTPAIRRSRMVFAAGNSSSGESVPQAKEAQLDFDRLHAWSVRLEGGVLVLGIGLVGLTARRFQE